MNMTNRVTQMKKTKLIIMAGIMAISSTAFAAKHDTKPLHSQGQQYVYGKVLEVTPVYRQIRVNHPVQECWSEPVRYPSRNHYSNNNAGNTLAGGLIGGIIGHQFGDGRGRDLATAVGTSMGAQAGHDSSRNHYDQPSYDTRESRYEERCETHNRVSYEEVVDSYKVRYIYKGKRYQTDMPYDPGKKIKLKVSVDPVY